MAYGDRVRPRRPVVELTDRLGSAANLRRHFGINVGVTPTDYRRAFRDVAPPGPPRVPDREADP